MGKSTSKKRAIPTAIPQWDRWLYRIGCPVWGCREWTDSIYPAGTPTDSYLRWYSCLFPAVEGNSTFYALPSKETFGKWRDEASPTFQFCFKFPREISHQRRLLGCNDLLTEWLDRLEVLRDSGQLGPTFLQLPPSFSWQQFPELESFLRALPKDWPWGVELRHPDWYDGADRELQLDTLLSSLSIDRVIFDSRPLNATDAQDASEQAAQSRKPKTPLRLTVTGKRPMVRLIGRNQLEPITEYMQQWSETIAGWIHQGYQPWIFTHAPDDQYAPFLARHLHDSIRLLIPSLPPLPTLAQVQVMSSATTDEPQQLRLF